MSCDIYGRPVSFLVDTGVGVSLLNKALWDKISRVDKELNPVVSHCIMGVDGMPIKVHGSVSIPITINGEDYKHKFIVAEQLINEAILGLDFMETNKCILDLVIGKITISNQTVSLIPH